MEGGCEKSVKRTQETPHIVNYSLLGWGIFSNIEYIYVEDPF